jgi:hypothetical protein
MKKKTFDDDAFGKTTIRPDGRALHPSYLFRVKGPSQSKYAGDVYGVLTTRSARSLTAVVCSSKAELTTRDVQRGRSPSFPFTRSVTLARPS